VRLAATLLILLGVTAAATLAAESLAPLILERTIAHKSVSGRIDHLAVDPAVSAETRRTGVLPGVASALSFSAADVLGKIVFNDGMDVLSFATARGLLTTLFFWFWLRHAPPSRPHTRRQRIVSLTIGLMSAASTSACCWRFSCCRCPSP
jgi:hypothetical protein